MQATYGTFSSADISLLSIIEQTDINEQQRRELENSFSTLERDAPDSNQVPIPAPPPTTPSS